ncbi:hypothetical protein LUZ60_009249 [Juncus effusus]|nr:hypothetical protein LUZ60_009249 [Juncus effusus]
MLQGGSKDSKIIITTRSENVAALSGAAKSCKLDVLSYDHCWNLFYRRAFTSESEKNDKDLSRIGREIVKKCGGVPLAAKSLGYTMRLKKGVDAWLEVRDSDIWWFEEKNGSSFKTAMLPLLKLSYYFMPSYLKLCFVYCSIFPKGSEIRKNDLIQQWIALGFIQPTHEGLSLVKRGEQYVKDLLGMSFLQLTGPSGRFPNGLHMHDLVHDLARYIVGNELLILDAKQGISSHFVGNDYYYALLLNFEDITRVYPNLRKTIREIFFCSHFQKSPDDCRKKMQFPVNTVSHAKCLRMLHFGHCYLTEFPDSLRKMKQLRYLSARGAKLQVLPESFGDLINLRYLCISYNCFKKLAVSFGNLTNLQILILDGCQELGFLPEPLNLVNMNELSLHGCNNLKKLPDTVGNSTMLRILDISYCRALSITPSFVGILGRLIKLDMVGSQYPLSLSILRDFATNFFLVKEGTSHLYDIIEINEMIAL